MDFLITNLFFSELAKANNYDLELFWSASYDDVYSTYFVDYSDELLHEFSNYQKTLKEIIIMVQKKSLDISLKKMMTQNFQHLVKFMMIKIIL